MLEAAPMLCIAPVAPRARETDERRDLLLLRKALKYDWQRMVVHQTTGRSQNWERLGDNCHKKKINGSISQIFKICQHEE